jgi:hypothetical protein
MVPTLSDSIWLRQISTVRTSRISPWGSAGTRTSAPAGWSSWNASGRSSMCLSGGVQDCRKRFGMLLQYYVLAVGQWKQNLAMSRLCTLKNGEQVNLKRLWTLENVQKQEPRAIFRMESLYCQAYRVNVLKSTSAWGRYSRMPFWGITWKGEEKNGEDVKGKKEERIQKRLQNRGKRLKEHKNRLSRRGEGII